MSRRRKPPLLCAHCGMARWNDESVRWLGPTWDHRQPYCADPEQGCAALIERELAEAGV